MGGRPRPRGSPWTRFSGLSADEGVSRGPGVRPTLHSSVFEGVRATSPPVNFDPLAALGPAPDLEQAEVIVDLAGVHLRFV